MAAARSLNHYDVIVIGIGGMGSATAYQLASRGKKVLGLEQFDIPHTMGSSHGLTRIIRLAYFEDPSYVPLLRRAYELWHVLEQLVGETLLHTTGSLDIGTENSLVFKGARQSAALHDLRHEILDNKALRARYPAYQLPADMMALFQPDGGFLTPEQCIVSHVTAAQSYGADIRAREPVLDWEPTATGVTVRTIRGTYTADKIVLTAGAWIGKLVPFLKPVAVPERQVLIWMQPKDPAQFAPERFPVFVMSADTGDFYGFPIHGVPGFKLGRYHHLNETVDPDQLDRNLVTAEDERVLRDFANQYFPDGVGPTQALKVCLFTNTADEHFILDTHPDYPQVVIGSPCSGHGFKFCTVIGEILADLAFDGQTRHNIELHRLKRLMG